MKQLMFLHLGRQSKEKKSVRSITVKVEKKVQKLFHFFSPLTASLTKLLCDIVPFYSQSDSFQTDPLLNMTTLTTQRT